VGKVLQNDFSWSKSRHEKFSECRRAYLFHYYRAWGGWESGAAKETKELYVLKRLANRFTWGGSVVHDAIRGSLEHVRAGRPLDPARAIDRAHRAMQDDFKASKRRAYWNGKIRKEFNGLVEHEYGEDVPDGTWKQNWENVKQALSWFFESRWPGLAKTLAREAWLEVDTTDFDRSFFTLDGVKVFAVPDFAFTEEGGVAHIVDWKTGRARDGYDEQVLGYALYLEQRYGLVVARMKATLVYLNDGVEKTVAVEPHAIEGFKKRFSESVGAMRSVLKDPRGNVPHPESHFPQTEDLAACARCPFRRPCGREAAAKQAAAKRSEAVEALEDPAA
jgi:hypothetical protein